MAMNNLYTFDTVYRGQQVQKQVCAKTRKEAAEKLGVNLYTVDKYVLRIPTMLNFDFVSARIDSGQLFRDRPDLIRKKMPWPELKAIIDEIKDAEHKEFLKRINKTRPG